VKRTEQLARKRPPGWRALARRSGSPPSAAGWRRWRLRPRPRPRSRPGRARASGEAEAEARARQLAEQKRVRQVVRECRRLEQERSDGRALLANFVATYGKVDEFQGDSRADHRFLDKARKVKAMPPA